MVNTPIPHSLKSEAKKAAKILREFTMPNSKAGPDKLIPVGILARARGLAILTVFKAGFLVTARGGSGIVIAKVSDELDYSEGWSAPSAIGMAGLGGGLEVGAEVTDFVIILNTQAAVEAFSKGGNLTLGGNFTLAVGPMGRNIEGDVALRSPAAIYTYSRTKGIFAGISVEGSALIERKDANRKFYGREIRAFEILGGGVSPPEECAALYQVMKEHQELAARAALQLAKKQAAKHAHAAHSRLTEATGISLPSFSKSSKSSGGESTKSGSSFSPKSVVTKTTVMKKVFSSSSSSSSSSSTSMKTPSSPDVGGASHHRMKTVSKTTTSYTGDSMRRSTPDAMGGGMGGGGAAAFAITPTFGRAVVSPVGDGASCRVVALFPYQAQLTCDLSFSVGEEMEVLTRTGTQDDWWEGRVRGQVGIFPANYVRVL